MTRLSARLCEIAGLTPVRYSQTQYQHRFIAAAFMVSIARCRVSKALDIVVFGQADETLPCTR
jgi:hypothetical protein